MKTSALTELLTPVVVAAGLEIDRVEVLPAGRRSLVRIFLDGDGPNGTGPSLDEISAATVAISTALDGSDVTGNGPYTLEVSSRGVGRPLTEPKHFRRNRGRLVELSGPELSLTGRIQEVTGGELTLDVDGETRLIPLDQVASAVVQVEMNRPIADEEE